MLLEMFVTAVIIICCQLYYSKVYLLKKKLATLRSRF